MKPSKKRYYHVFNAQYSISFKSKTINYLTRSFQNAQGHKSTINEKEKNTHNKH